MSFLPGLNFNQALVEKIDTEVENFWDVLIM